MKLLTHASVFGYTATLLLIGGCTTTPEQDPADVAGSEFRDCPDCPAMITVPAGNFLMGTAEGDGLIDPRTGKPASNDRPQHAVTLAAPFAVGKYEITAGDYSRFVAATAYEPSAGCMEFSGEAKFTISDEVDWSNTGFPQTSDHPVVCMSYFDAQAYTNWLSETTGHSYRLPTDAEWEYAARAGTSTVYFWGTDTGTSCQYVNVRSQGADSISRRQVESDKTNGFPCDDGAANTSSAGMYQPNQFGLHDMQGNVWEWVIDCNHKDYNGAPADGSAWLDDKPCNMGLIRGGSFINLVERSSVTVRAGRPRSGRATNMGFRVVRDGTRKAEAIELVDTAPAFGSTGDMDVSTEAAQLFADNCAACHLKSSDLKGLYGKDQDSLVDTIASGGNNVMSMPAFDDRLSDDEINALASYLRKINNWN